MMTKKGGAEAAKRVLRCRRECAVVALGEGGEKRAMATTDVRGEEGRKIYTTHKRRKEMTSMRNKGGVGCRRASQKVSTPRPATRKKASKGEEGGNRRKRKPILHTGD